jgi:3-deoxy-D-manno-octulosonic-acid transferase
VNALDVVYLVAAGLAAPIWMRKDRADWPARFGRMASLPEPRAGLRRLLVHAVSVGEVNALRHMVPLLAGECDLVISVGTDTGIARAREIFASHATVVRYPIDFSKCVRRFLDAVRPDAVGLVELEIWPNFIGECTRRGIPVAVVNGRLSERSFRGYRRLRPLIGRSFARLAFAAVQDAEYHARFLHMGVAAQRCSITGSMKWDAAKIEDDVPGAAELAAELGIDRSRPLIVAGSTGPGEEALLHGACPKGVQLLCGPRKPERFGDAAAGMPGCVRRSAKERGAPGAERFLLDTIGELRRAYALADVVVVGRSFGDLYGSDPIEPAALGKPVVIGPVYGDFRSIVEAMRDRGGGGGGIVVAERGELPGVLSRLLADGAERVRLASAARACVVANQGASARHAEMLLGLLRRRVGRSH